MKRLLKSDNAQHVIFSFGGQIAALLSNFVLFVYLAKNYSQEDFGLWAIFITTISIGNGYRQGFVQNGLSRLLIKTGFNSRVVNSGLLINFGLIAGLSLAFAVYGWLANNSSSILYIQSFKALFSLGILQFVNTLDQAQHQFKRYFRNNVIYLIGFVGLFGAHILWLGNPTLLAVMNIMLIATLPISLLMIKEYVRWTKPRWVLIKELIQFGKYASGTNMLSLLFQRVDILMIGYFLGPAPVAIFHFANKIMNYAELPLQALSQVIYPKISASSHDKSEGQLNKTYGRSILWLFAFVFPIAIMLIAFNHTIIHLLGNESFLEASWVIVILSLASLVKPWGRVFGLTLDAVGKPKVNFYMLVFSLVVNIVLNLLLIPSFGLIGGAIATGSAVVITILIGQFKLNKELKMHPLHTVWDAIKEIINKKTVSWN